MEQFFTDFLTEISPALQKLLVLVALALVAQLSEFITKQRKAINAKLTVDQQVLLNILAERAMQTVEQIYKEAGNERKMLNAISLVEGELLKAGLTVDLDVIENAIEAQVFKKNQALPQG